MILGGSKNTAAEKQLQQDIGSFVKDPLAYVMYNWPWQTNPLIRIVKMPKFYQDEFDCEYGPDAWAIEFLEELRAQIEDRNFDGHTPVRAIQFSTASGHGIGKSAKCAWLGKFILDTRPMSRGTMTANTAEQLKTKTWAAVGFWHKMSLTRHWFKYNAGRGNMSLTSTMKNTENQPLDTDWFLQALTCREENSEAFAGQHAPTATSFYLFDEGSGIPNGIYEVREGGLTDGEPMSFDFGNPTQNSGTFFENTAGRFKKNFIVRQIDSRTVAITNKELFKRWEETYGADSDFFKVRVRGVFPSQGSLQFIPSNYVDDAMSREAPDVSISTPLVLGVDLARHGDDETVIYPRMGMDARTWTVTRIRSHDCVEVTQRIIAVYQEFAALGKKVKAIFVDSANFGIGVCDMLRHAGYPVIAVHPQTTPGEPLIYRYRIDELWGRTRDALRNGLVLPPQNTELGGDLYRQLTQREFGYTKTGAKIHLEPKADMKERLGGDASSPDIADALSLTYAMDMIPEGMDRIGGNKGLMAISEWDPHNTEGQQQFLKGIAINANGTAVINDF